MRTFFAAAGSLNRTGSFETADKDIDADRIISTAAESKNLAALLSEVTKINIDALRRISGVTAGSTNRTAGLYEIAAIGRAPDMNAATNVTPCYNRAAVLLEVTILDLDTGCCCMGAANSFNLAKAILR